MALSHLMKAILLCGAAVVVTSQDASEEELTRMGIIAFKKMDRNGDGWISVNESLANYDQSDTNRDGIWTLSEYSQLAPGANITDPVKKQFNFYDRLDGNRDGKLQRSSIEPLFRSNDLNGDGRVTEDEIITFFITRLGPAMAG